MCWATSSLHLGPAGTAVSDWDFSNGWLPCWLPYSVLTRGRGLNLGHHGIYRSPLRLGGGTTRAAAHCNPSSSPAMSIWTKQLGDGPSLSHFSTVWRNTSRPLSRLRLAHRCVARAVKTFTGHLVGVRLDTHRVNVGGQPGWVQGFQHNRWLLPSPRRSSRLGRPLRGEGNARLRKKQR